MQWYQLTVNCLAFASTPAASVESSQQQYWAAIPPVHRVSWLSGLRGSGTNMKPPPQGPWARCNPKRWMHSKRETCMAPVQMQRVMIVAKHKALQVMSDGVLTVLQSRTSATRRTVLQVPCTLLSRMV